MLFPLARSWLRPLFGSALVSTKTASKYQTGFRTIGGTDTTGRRGPTNNSKPSDAGSLSACDSEERIVHNVKLQNLKPHAGPGSSDHLQPGSIIVSREFQLVDDKANQNDNKHTQESW